MKNILISTPNESLSNELRTSLQDSGYTTVCVTNGRDAQLKIYQSNFHALILDIETKNHSCMEVLKYVKLNRSPIIILLYFSTKKQMEHYDLNEESFQKTGVTKVFFGTAATKEIPKHISQNGLGKWKGVIDLENQSAETDSQPSTIQDAKMTRIKISNFIDESISIFDHYLKLSENKYIKILKKGDSLYTERLQKYISDGIEHFYFQTKDRAEYINYMNSMAAKITFSKPEKAIKLVKDTTTKLVEEIYTIGIHPLLVEEGHALCKSIHQIVKSDFSLNKLLDEYKEMDPASYNHLFLVSFFSMVICQNLDWAGEKTKEMIGLAALLHDIGMLKVPEIIRNKKPSTMSPQELGIYYLHPLYGYEMLDKYPCINEQVKQIVYQHHEKVSGSGFPNRLTGLKIYPLAKIVSVADAFAEILVDNKMAPLAGVKFFLNQREKIIHYDPLVLRALVAGLSRNRKSA